MHKPEAKPDSDVQATSSTPLELPEEQEALFREVLTSFEKARRPYAVAGAFALRQHTGICRFSKDLEIFLSTEAASEALICFRKTDVVREVSEPVWLAKGRRGG